MTPDHNTNTDPPPSDPGVSARTAKPLHDAMERPLAGRPQRSDGRLIKDNLWREAGVSRAAMNRATDIITQWEARAGRRQLHPSGSPQKRRTHPLRADLAARTRECTQLRHQLDAAATAIAALHHDNTLLRQELDHTGQLIPITSRKP
jgi:hypothetical protein